MYEIPKPQTLDPGRPLRKRGTEFTADDRPEPELLRLALEESCAYAEQLWDTLNAQRAYLLDSLPPDPRAPHTEPQFSASPTGPDDEPGWEHWMSTFAATTSALCGPHGDSGFGLSRARQAAEIRRSVPPALLAGNEPQPSDGNPRGSGESPPHRPETAASSKHPCGPSAAISPLRAGLTIGVALAAVRGLLPRRRRPRPSANF